MPHGEEWLDVHIFRNGLCACLVGNVLGPALVNGEHVEHEEGQEGEGEGSRSVLRHEARHDDHIKHQDLQVPAGPREDEQQAEALGRRDAVHVAADAVHQGGLRGTQSKEEA